MNPTDAVSCLLCLQADEYGSMIKVCVPPGRIPPSTEKVICRLCAAIITSVLDSQEGEQIGPKLFVAEPEDGAELDPGRADRPGDPDWDQSLPERANESVVEVDRSEPENATGSSKE